MYTVKQPYVVVYTYSAEGNSAYHTSGMAEYCITSLKLSKMAMSVCGFWYHHYKCLATMWLRNLTLLIYLLTSGLQATSLALPACSLQSELI